MREREATRDEAFSEWEEMFALNGSISYGNEICGSHRSARPIFKVSASLRYDSKFLGQGDDIFVCMREKMETGRVRF